MRHRIGLCLITVIVAGCGKSQEAPADSPLRVAAASDLQKAFPILAARFQLDHNIKAIATFKASGQLTQQLEQGAPFDLFLAANRRFVEELAAKKIIDPASVRPYARGSLVLVVNETSGVTIQGIDDLVRPEVKKIAIANPDSAPYGAAAKQALQKAGLWDKLQPKIVRGESVGQAFQYVESGNAEVGFVGRALLGVKGIKAQEVDPAFYTPLVQVLGVVSASRRRSDASKFADFLLSDVGQGILADFGFSSPETSSKSKSKGSP